MLMFNGVCLRLVMCSSQEGVHFSLGSFYTLGNRNHIFSLYSSAQYSEHNINSIKVYDWTSSQVMPLEKETLSLMFKGA